MKNRIKNKLCSQAGASITYALLLFLVCAVLCSVLLTAATASSGRMSQIAETDQRYYAVTSAAKSLKDMIEGSPVSIVKVQTEGEEGVLTYLVSGKMTGEINDTDLTEDNLINKVKIDSIPKDAAKMIDSALSKKDLNLVFNSADTSVKPELLNVTIKEKIDDDSNITFTIYNTKNSKGSDSRKVNGIH